MARVSDLLAWLAGRPSDCRHCGEPLMALVGSGLVAVVCPGCDVTAGTVPARGRAGLLPQGVTWSSPVEHHAEHRVSIDGCSECANEAWFRGRRAG